MKYNDRVNLTDSQMGVYLVCGSHPESIMYNVPFYFIFELDGKAKEERQGDGSEDKGTVLLSSKGKTIRTVPLSSLSSVIDDVLRLHPAMYSRIISENGAVFMERMPFPEAGICRLVDLDGEGIEKRRTAPPQPFDLSQSPLCRAEICICDHRIHLFLECHHLIFDGSSMSCLVRQFADALAGKPVEGEIIDPFRLYDLEQETAASPFYQEARDHFEKLLSMTEADSKLIADQEPGPEKSVKANLAIRQLTLPHLADFRRRYQITHNTFFMGVYGYALAKMTGQQESFFVAGESGRKKDPALMQTVGMMVRTLPVVMQIDEKQPVGEMLRDLQKQFRTSVQYNCCALGELYQKYHHQPDVAFVYQGRFLEGFQWDHMRVQPSIQQMDENDAPLTCFVFRKGDAFELWLYYHRDLYRQETIDRFLDCFEQTALAFADEIPMDQIDLLNPADRQKLDALNQCLPRDDGPVTVVDLFRRSVGKGPEKTAVSFCGKQYSYRETDDISDRIAAYIQARQRDGSFVLPEQDNKNRPLVSHSVSSVTVGILLPRCETMVFAALGVLKAGCAYQPLDPSYPPERLNFMLRDSDAKLLIADRTLLPLVSDYTGPVLLKDEIGTLPETHPSPVDLKRDNTAVLLYTSGTTGTPKGCQITNGNLAAMTHAWTEVIQLDGSGCVGAYASFGFDAHLGDFYPALACGAQIDIVPEDLRLDLSLLKDHCEKVGMTHMVMTTQVARQFAMMYKEVKGFRCLSCGGEKLVAFDPDMHYRFVNGYGPSECTMASNYFVVDRYYEDIPIGRALPGLKLYIVDPFGRRVPIGVPGELIVCGPQVSAGYLNRPEQTEKVFVPNTFEPNPGAGYERCYKTGDIVRMQDDGNLLFVGRRDKQVKIRGFRIELSEVEKVIRDYPGIKDATVVDRDAPSGGKCIHAYIVADEKIDIAGLNAFISERKPPYMVPAATMQIDRIPLNVNGKVDRRNLPEPERIFEDIEKPSNDLQQRIFDSVAEIVGTADFGIHTDIYQVGLTSIGSIRLCALLAEVLDRPVTIRDLKRCQTVAGLEKWAAAGHGDGSRLLKKYDLRNVARQQVSGDSSSDSLYERVSKNRPPDSLTSSVLSNGSFVMQKESNMASHFGGKSSAEMFPQSSVPEFGPAVPITKTMEGIFTECFGKPDSTVYNIPYLLKLGENIDEERLKKAIAEAVEAHPGMKGELFTDTEGNICFHRRLNDIFTAADVKVVEKSSNLQESVNQASHFGGSCHSGAVTDGGTKGTGLGEKSPAESFPNDVLDSHDLVKPFKLTDSRLFEISLIHADGTYLFINIHHIIFDGTSMALFIRDIERAYAGETLTPEQYTAFDVAAEEQRMRTEAELEAEEAYYDALLNDTDKDFLPLSDQRPDMPESSGRLQSEQIEADAAIITDFCRRQNLSLNAYFTSVFGTVLAKYAGMDYAVFNTVYSGRNDSRTENTAAMLVKTFPVVCRIDGENTAELIREIGTQLMDSMTNDLYAYAEISKHFGVKNDVMFIFQGDGFARDRFCGAPAEEIPLSLSDAKTALNLQVMIRGGKVAYDLEYDPKRFSEKLMTAFVHTFDQAAACFVKTEKLQDMVLLSKSDADDMDIYNATETAYDRNRTIADLFLENAALQPNALCVQYQDKHLTYGKVEELTAKLAYYLMQQGIGRGEIVGILIHRDENMVIGAHGVIRSGAAYLGLDPTYPEDRLAFMMQDSGAKMLIADRSLADLLKTYTGPVIYTDEIENLPAPSAAEMAVFTEKEAHRLSPEDPAIVIYSSGTTGVPKGSVLRHRNIVCFYQNYTADMAIGVGSHVATYASFGFDGGAMDVFCVPMAGASLYVIPDEIRMDLRRLEEFYVKHGITSGFMTTQVGCMFIAATKCRTLRRFIVGGEKLIPVTGPEWVMFCNGYGPSECMCYVNHCEVRSSGSLQPIGKVSGNTKEYIIDAFGHRLPYGACGELCIAGGQVGKGYLNRPEKTAEAFVPNPFTNDPDYGVMYKTGDIVRMLPDGNYDFVGRRDGQVKIRGFRVELSEIEQQIREFPGVINTVVTAFETSGGGKTLAAYVVMNAPLDVEALKEAIGKEKPAYMIPTVVMQVDEIPLTGNGKVDKKKLPKPVIGTLKKGAEPANETEEKLCAIFAEVTGVDRVYADDDFFKIGGSSILAIRAIVKCEQAGFPVVYKNLFANPTPRQLADFIAGSRVRDVTAADLNKDDRFEDSALVYNVMSNLPQIRNEGIGNVLLTGVTGFLGSHLFREVIRTTSGNVICLIRGRKDLPAEIRFKTIMTYYFEDWYQDGMRGRTTIIDGALEDADILDKLRSCHFDTIINCAANVKHFAVENELMSSNFSGVENLIQLAEVSGAKLIQISSLSVSGESVNGSVPKDTVFRENNLNIGQSLENRYIYTKYLGEQAVIDAVSRKKIRGKVIRLGNLMARIDDSQFQVNAGQNALLLMYRGFVKLGCFPVNMLDAEIEFSPIDSVARAVVLLAGTPDDFTVFHAKNGNAIHYGYLLKAVQEAGFPIDIVEDDVFEVRLRQALQNEDDAEELGGLLAYRNTVDDEMVNGTQHIGDEDLSAVSERRVKIPSSTTYTVKALYRLGFSWPLISMDYLKEMVRMLTELDFFEM